ncbi:MAG: hypothetical protein DCC55_21995 [Chloroflexi bacterium]|nr:MAG: hypothetical protein DCC55_21995 [Chloroflexota bacterium]
MKSIMPEPLSQSLLCPTLIGREAQLFALAELLGQARQGHGQIAMISGEAGIGKSRLVAEVKQVAAGQGCSILQGNCFEPDRALPYAPLLDLLRGFCAAGRPGAWPNSSNPTPSRWSNYYPNWQPRRTIRLPPLPSTRNKSNVTSSKASPASSPSAIHN